MQLLESASEPAAAAACAAEVLDSIPPVMQFIRHVAHQRRARGLSVQQFRALGYLRRRPGDSLSSLAEHLGLTPSSASRLVDGLVAKGLLRRAPVPGNRRQVRLTPTARGARLLEDAVATTRQRLSAKLAELSDERRARIAAAVRDLRELFEPEMPLPR